MKIAITGPLADRNLGDYAMYVNNIYDIGSENEYVVFHYSREFVEELNNDYFYNFNCRYTEVKLSESFFKAPKLMERAAKYILKKLSISPHSNQPVPTPVELVNAVENIQEIKEQLKDIDILVVSGGGYFNKLWYEWARKDDLIKIIVPIIVAKMMRKKIVFTANGYGPFDESDKFYSEIFGYIDGTPLGIRDKIMSSTYLKRLGVDNERLNYLPDDLYILNDSLKKRVNSVTHYTQKYIVIEFYYPVSWVKENINAIKQFVDEVKEKYDLDVVYLPFDETPVAGYLSENISASSFHIFESSGTYLKLEDAIAILKNSEFVLCNRYHALVLSVSNKVPVINIMKSVYDLRYYFNKNSGLVNNAFDNIDFDEAKILQTDYLKALEQLMNNMPALQGYYFNLYSNNNYEINIENLKNSRFNYFKKHISN